MNLARWIEIWTDLILAICGAALAYSVAAGVFSPHPRIAWLMSIVSMVVCLLVVVEGWVIFHKEKSTSPAISAFSKVGCVFIFGGTIVWIAAVLFFPVYLQINPSRAIGFLVEAFFAGLASQFMLLLCKGIKEGLSLIKTPPSTDNLRSAPYGLAFSCLSISAAFCAASCVGMYNLCLLIKEPIVNFMISK